MMSRDGAAGPLVAIQRTTRLPHFAYCCRTVLISTSDILWVINRRTVSGRLMSLRRMPAPRRLTKAAMLICRRRQQGAFVSCCFVDTDRGCFTGSEGTNGTATIQPEASRDLDIAKNVLRRWIKETDADPV